MTPLVKCINNSTQYDKQDAKEEKPNQLTSAFSSRVLCASEAEHGRNLGDREQPSKCSENTQAPIATMRLPCRN